MATTTATATESSRKGLIVGTGADEADTLHWSALEGLRLLECKCTRHSRLTATSPMSVGVRVGRSRSRSSRRDHLSMLSIVSM